MTFPKQVNIPNAESEFWGGYSFGQAIGLRINRTIHLLMEICVYGIVPVTKQVTKQVTKHVIG